MLFLDDPLTISGSLDGERFEVPASFCFRRLAGLKTHLKAVHGVKTLDMEGTTRSSDSRSARLTGCCSRGSRSRCGRTRCRGT